jgi:predicted MFS family arabinose efflux permease
MTVMNGATMLSPLAAGILVGTEGFSSLYLVSSVVLFFGILYAALAFRNIPTRTPKQEPFLRTLFSVLRSRNIRNITAVHFLLQFFYAIMVVYAPLYLRNTMGFSWPEIGIISAIFLSPFVLIELPLGRIADRLMGEKELLVAGFIIMALATATIPFLGYASLPLFAITLLLTRIGAATVEIMSETYFFKKVNERETGRISFFRNMQPLAYVVAPLLATFFLYRWSSREIFFALAIVLILGIYFSLRLRDTR